MSQSTALATYQVVGNREDLTDLISIITLYETPIYNDLQKTKAKATYHEWQTDTLSTGNSNAQIEGADYVFSRPGARTRTGNYTQILEKTIEVTMTQQAVDEAGAGTEYDKQLQKRIKEIGTDIEYALINATANSGASGTARTLKGILAWLTTNVETGTGTAARYLTETYYNNLLQTIWSGGGRPDTTYVNGFQKRQISAFSTPNQRQIQMADSDTLKNFVNVYQSDFGMQKVKLDSFAPTNQTMVLETDKWAVAILRGLEEVAVPRIGSAKRGAMEIELTLEARNQASSGTNTNLLTS